MADGGKNLMNTMLTIVIGLALVGTVATFAVQAQDNLTDFPAVAVLVGIVVLVFVVIIIYAAFRAVSGGK